jgi:hypothetical protein
MRMHSTMTISSGSCGSVCRHYSFFLYDHSTIVIIAARPFIPAEIALGDRIGLDFQLGLLQNHNGHVWGDKTLYYFSDSV